MTGKTRLLSLVAVLAVISIITVSVASVLLYNSAFEQQRARLIDTVKSRANLINAIARHEQNATFKTGITNPDLNPIEATLSQLRKAHTGYDGLGETGEFTLARRERDQMVFLLRHRHHDFDNPQPVSFSSPHAEPMRRALSGESGVMVGLDYRGERVLAAYESVAELDLGIVAKVDLSEIREPFIRAGLVAVGIAMVLISFGAILFFRIGNPMVRELVEKEDRLRDIARTIPGGVYQFVLDKDGNISFPYVGGAIDDLAGIKASILTEDATKLYDLVHADDHAFFKESIRLSAETITPWDHEFRVVTRGRGTKWLHGRANPRLLPDGSILWNGVFTDITERKRVDEELQNTTDYLQHLIDYANAPIIVWDPEYRITRFNHAFENLTQLSADEVLGKNLSILFPGENCDNSMAHIKRTTSGEKWDTVEIPIQQADGNIRIVLWNSANIYEGKDESLIATIAQGQDITERKKAEEERERTREFMQTVIDGIPDCLMVINRDFTIELANRAVREIAREKGPVGAGSKCYHMTHARGKPCDCSECPCPLEQVFASKASVTVEHLHHSAEGHAITLEIIAAPIFDEKGEVVQVIESARDITVRKQAEEALVASEKRLRNITESMADWIWEVDSEGAYTYASSKVELILGYRADEVIGRSPFDFMVPEEAERVRKLVQLIVADKEPIHDLENWNLTKDGRSVCLLTNGIPLFDDQGNLLGYRGVDKDITKRKQAEEALRESEEKFRMYISSAPDAIFITDAQGRYVEVNEAACEMTSYSRSELTRMSIPDIVDPDTCDEPMDGFRELKRAGVRKVEFKLKRKDGSIIWTSMNAVSLSEDRFMAFCSDITETKRLQALESRAERLETAGTIAGQVAHDFNNLLAPIMAYPGLIRDELPPDHKAQAYLDDIEMAAQKIAEINQDLLTMGRRGHYNQDVMDLNRIVSYAASETESRANNVTCEMDLCEDLMRIKGGAAQIHRLLTNLLVNAEDAMEDVGRITVKTENYYADDTSITYGRVPRGEYVKLTISDTGCGVPEDIIQKILDPFFSTKAADKKRGSGLGLSVVDAVMKDHGGYLDMSSEVGHGTSFYLYFPITREDVGESETDKRLGGTGTVLVVDDDDIQRKVSSMILAKLGYEVSAVESGTQAVEFLKEHPQDLLVLDMIMPPGMDGAETFRRVREINPDQKAIIVSGFSESDRVLEAQKLGAGAFVKKPLTKEAIAVAVRHELDREAMVKT